MGQMQNLHITANGQVCLGKGRILRSAILSPGSTASTLTLYDNSAASGTILATLVASANGYSVDTPDLFVNVETGIYAAIAGTGATADVYFE